MKYGIAAIFLLMGIAGSMRLMLADSATFGPSFLVLVGTFGLLCIFFSERVDWFDVKSLRVQLRKVETARQEVEDVALALAEITSFMAAFHRRLGSEESHRIEQEWMQTKVENLLDGLNSDSNVRSRIMKYLEVVRKMDAIRESNSDESERLWKKIWADIQAETKDKTANKNQGKERRESPPPER